MKILPDYEHMEYRDVYTCRTYSIPCTVAAAVAAWLTTGSLPGPGEILIPDLFSFALLQLWFAVVGHAEW